VLWSQREPNQHLPNRRECSARQVGPPERVSDLAERLNSKAVRDLLYALSLPRLASDAEMRTRVVGGDTRTVLSHYKWFEELDRNPAPLIDAIRKDKTARVLGNYFAKLWEFFIAHHCRLEGLRSKLQVRDPATKRTLGAFDLTFLRDGEIEHWEISFKCKLYVPRLEGKFTPQPPQSDRAGAASASLQALSGPHLSETLEDKVNKVHKQLELARTPQGEAALRREYKRDSAVNAKTTCVLSGILLYPMDIFWASAREESAGRGGGQALRCEPYGWWTEDLHSLRDRFPNSFWYVLQKLEWLAPLHPDALQGLRDKGELLPTVEFIADVERRRRDEKLERRRRVYVAEVRYDRSLWRFYETSRGFVVEEGWSKKFLATR